ncbi:hypothetical protein BH11CYA1_BH11CYA1_07850 [soil metagenome]
MSTLQDLGQAPLVQFVRLPEVTPTKPQKSITLKQGQSVTLIGDGVTIKVANNKFHSLKATTFVLVKFDMVDTADEQQDTHQVEPAQVGTSITCNGKTLGVVTKVESKSKLLTIDLADGVQVQNDI